MVLFRVAWSLDIMVALVFVFFFVIGVGDGTVSSRNIVLWLATLGGIAAIVFGARALARRGSVGLATVIAALPAVPALLYGLMIGLAVVTGARWN